MASRINPLRLLLGAEPTNSVKWEEEVLKELEDQEDDPDYFLLLQQCIDYFKRQDYPGQNPY